MKRKSSKLSFLERGIHNTLAQLKALAEVFGKKQENPKHNRCRSCSRRYRLPEGKLPYDGWTFCSHRCADPGKFPPTGKYYEQTRKTPRQIVRCRLREKALEEQKKFRSGKHSYTISRQERRRIMHERANRWYREGRGLPEPR